MYSTILSDRVALVQLATHENIYLLDMIALDDTGQIDAIRTFFNAFLCGKEVLKLGKEAIQYYVRLTTKFLSQSL